MRYYRTFLACCFFFVFSVGFAQQEELQLKVYGFEDGLSHRNIFKIAQDKQGFIWISTINGLNRFDGIRFVHHHSQSIDHPLPQDYVSDFVIDPEAKLYLASSNQLASLNTKNGQTKNFPFQEKNTIPNNLFLDTKNTLWYTYFSAQSDTTFLKKWDSTTQKSEQIAALSGSYLHSPIVQRDSFIYVGNRNELWQFSLQGEFINKQILPTTAFITNIVIDTQKTLWILCKTGELFQKTTIQPTIKAFPLLKKIEEDNEYHALCIAQNGDIWLGGLFQFWQYKTASKRLIDYNPKIRQRTKNNLNYRQIYEDQQGIIWVATDFGAIKLVQSNKFFQTYLSEGSEYCNNGFCSMRGITGDGKRYIYFSYYNSIHILDTETGLLTPLLTNQRFYNPPFDLFYHKDKLYTGNGQAIDLTSFKIDTLFDLPANDKGTIMLDNDDILWFGYEQFLLPFNIKNNTSAEDEFTILKNAIPSDINYLYQGNFKRYIWIATNEDGLIRFDKREKSLQTYSVDTPQALLSNRVLTLYEDSKQNLWIGTAKGLNRLHLPSNNMTDFTTQNGLPNNFINGILAEGDSCIWMSTDNGLSRYFLKNNKFVNYYTQDGLSSNEFNRISFHQSPNGRLYFGGLNGINAFYPSEAFSIEQKTQEAPILFTNFSLYDGEVDSLVARPYILHENALVELDYRDKFFTFEYALANYKQPAQNQYSHILEGFETQWSHPTQNTATRYYNIPAGNYTFKVRAAPKGSHLGHTELQIPILIGEAFYRTSWFWLVCAIFMLAIIYGIVRYREYRMRENKRELEAEVQLRTQELAEEKQKSDELLLNILPAETAEELKRYGKAQAKRHESITVLFSDFKDFTKIASQLDPEILVNEIDLCFRKFDDIMEVHGLEKIKTIGDAYMCAGGLASRQNNMAVNVVNAALDIQEYLQQLAENKDQEGHAFFEARIGIHTGSVVAGIVGSKKFVYDIWGDTVNVAARMEKSGSVGNVNISAATYKEVKTHFECTYRGKIEVKNKGMVDMFYVDSKL